jgi:hypothetical protein
VRRLVSPVIVLLAGVACWIAGAMHANDGVFAYTLDDPYVHLELARGLAAGGHGINDGEFAASSSSVLWPLLLVPGWWLGDATLLPLVLNLLAGLGVLAAGAAASRRVLGDVSAGALVALVFVADAVALVSTGMEHLLQVALVAGLVVGLMDADAGKRVPAWAIACGAIAPLVRFECAGVGLVAAAWLAWRGQRGAGAALAAGVLVPLAAYAAFLVANTGHPLPNSVLSKDDMFPRAWRTIWQPEAFVPVLVAGAAALRTRGHLAWIALAAAVGHLAFGQVGLLGRYTAYVLVLAVLAAAWSWRAELRALVAGRDGRRLAAMIALVLASVHARATLSTVEASAHVWRLQGQMRRIADALDAPVAVNDVGWVSLGNPRYVLDLVGLASTEALAHRLAGDPPGWMADLAAARGVAIVMVFEPWFPEGLPPAWTRIGTLATERSPFDPTLREVALFVPDAARVDGVRATLEALELPPGTRLELLPPRSAGASP